MKKYLLVFAVALLAVSIAAPALADVQFLYGGQFRARYNAGDNVWDGTDVNGYYGNYRPQTLDTLGKPNSYQNSNDNRNYIDQRLRLYFSFVGSPNLKVVTKFEIGDTKWGDPGDGSANIGVRAGQNGGGNVGADQVAVEVKNAYMEFNIPNTPSTGIVGIQTITLLDSWIIDDDFSGAVLLTRLDPFRVAVGYIGGQYGAERRLGGTGAIVQAASASSMAYTNQDMNVDDGFVSVDFTCAPWKASFVAFYQDAHKTNTSIDPTTLGTPVSSFTGITDTGFMPVQNNIKSNDLIDLGFNVTYKTDWLVGYVNFVKNLGSVQYNNPVKLTTIGNTAGTGNATVSQSDYTGWMLDAGLTYFCAPFTFNVGGFYLTGPKYSDTPQNNGSGTNGAAQVVASNNPVPTVGGLPFRGTESTDVTWFTYPLATAKYTSEIIGGGVLEDDQHILRGFAEGWSASKMNFAGYGALSTVYWRGYYFPTNLWTLTAGSSWQVCPNTKLSLSYWYWGTAESVPVAYDKSSLTFHGAGAARYASATQYQMSDNIGSEVDFYIDQRIVDNLTLTLVAAYLFADDAFCPLPYATSFGATSTTIDASKYTTPQAQDAWKAGARLQWNF